MLQTVFFHGKGDRNVFEFDVVGRKNQCLDFEFRQGPQADVGLDIPSPIAVLLLNGVLEDRFGTIFP